MKSSLTCIALLVFFWAHGWTIRKSDEENTANRLAVEELEHYLSGSVRGEILLEGKPAEFLIGIRPDSAPPVLREGQWQIVGKDSKVYLYGGGARGTLYAVYHFLERQLGVRWWTPWEEYVPQHESLTLENIDAGGEPYFALRDIYRRNDGEWQEYDTRWGIRNRLNRNDDDFPGGKTPVGNLTYGRPYTVHTFDHYLNASKYLADHPEYFSEIDGKRVGGQFAGQLCLTNPDVRRIVREKLHEFIRLDREEALAAGTTPPRIYDISINDNTRYCRCKMCTAALAGGNQTDLLLDFINDVADSVRKEYPDIAISTLAYLYTEEIPVRTVPRDNVVVRLCDTATNPVFGFDVPENQPFARKLQQWSQLTDRLSIWDYGVIYVRPGLPYPHEYTLQETMRQYADRKVGMMFWEHEFADCADMWEMNTWLEARLLENPYADVEALRQDFLTGYYGPAAPEITAYRKTLYESAVRIHPYLHWFAAPALFDHLNLENLKLFSGLLDAAADKVRDNAELAIRVARVRMGVDRAILLRWGILAREHFAAGGSESDFPFDQEILKTRIRDTWERALKHLTESGREQTGKKMSEELNGYGSMPLCRSRVTEKPAFGPGAIVLTADTFNLFRSDLKFVADPDALGGVALATDVEAPLQVGVFAVVDNCELLAPQSIAGTPESDGSYQWYRLGSIPLRHISVVHMLGWRVQVPLDRITSRFVLDPDWKNIKYDIRLRVKFQNDGKHRMPVLDAIAVIPQNQG